MIGYVNCVLRPWRKVMLAGAIVGFALAFMLGIAVFAQAHPKMVAGVTTTTVCPVNPGLTDRVAIKR